MWFLACFSYALKLLLLHVAGATSFESLCTVDNIIHPTFLSTCFTLGLLDSDEHWIDCLQEACTVETNCSKIRFLFAFILANNNPSDPVRLWNMFKFRLYDDFYHQFRTNNVRYIESDLENLALIEINEFLCNMNKSLADFNGMPQIILDNNTVPRIIQ